MELLYGLHKALNGSNHMNTRSSIGKTSQKFPMISNVYNETGMEVANSVEMLMIASLQKHALIPQIKNVHNHD